MSEEMEREISYNADHWVSRYEIESRHGYERELAAQRLKISELESERISDRKDIELYKQVKEDIKNAIDPLKFEIHELKEKTECQAVWNATTKDALMRMHSDIEDLQRLTIHRIPRRVICPPIEDTPEP